jgi:hypothetical protein
MSKEFKLDQSVLQNLMKNIKITPTPKPKPGRPKKNPVKVLPQNFGVVNKPEDPMNIMEMHFLNINEFKRSVIAFLALSTNVMQCKFKKDKVSLLGNDKSDKHKVRILINPGELNMYYCKQPFEFGISYNHLDSVQKIISKNYDKFIWSHEIDAGGNNSDCTVFSLFTNIYSSCNKQVVACAGNYNKISDEDETEIDNAKLNANISFTLDAKFFKKMMSNIKIYNNVLRIYQMGCDCPLVFETSSNNQRIIATETFSDHKSINLESDLSSFEIFEIEMDPEPLCVISNVGSINDCKINFYLKRNLVFIEICLDSSIFIQVLLKVDKIIPQEIAAL